MRARYLSPVFFARSKHTPTKPVLLRSERSSTSPSAAACASARCAAGVTPKTAPVAGPAAGSAKRTTLRRGFSLASAFSASRAVSSRTCCGSTKSSSSSSLSSSYRMRQRPSACTALITPGCRRTLTRAPGSSGTTGGSEEVGAAFLLGAASSRVRELRAASNRCVRSSGGSRAGSVGRAGAAVEEATARGARGAVRGPLVSSPPPKLRMAIATEAAAEPAAAAAARSAAAATVASAALCGTASAA